MEIDELDDMWQAIASKYPIERFLKIRFTCGSPKRAANRSIIKQ